MKFDLMQCPKTKLDQDHNEKFRFMQEQIKEANSRNDKLEEIIDRQNEKGLGLISCLPFEHKISRFNPVLDPMIGSGCAVLFLLVL
jgi:hypothetical protein